MGRDDLPIDHDAGNEDAELIQACYNWEETAPSAAVVDTVAFAAHRELSDLPLLYEVVDPEALDTMVASASTQHAEPRLSISFVFAGYSVRVLSTGEVRVRPATQIDEHSN